MYLAILLKNEGIVDKLYKMSDHGTSLSYSGPNGPNALQAFAEKLLRWNKALSVQKDETGSMPLHFAAAKSPNSSYSTQFHDDLHEWRKSNSTIARKMRKKLLSLLGRDGWPKVCLKLLEANPAALYEPDHRGSYPIHIATSVGVTRKVLLFLNRHPGSAGLRDARGRTFLHVAVEKMAMGILYHATRDKSLEWILNMRDKEGNTAMHLAVQGGRLRVFCRLLGNLKVGLDLLNAKGETCLDLSRYKVPPGLYYSQNSEACIRRALAMVGARSGTSREDHFEEKYERNHRLKPEEKNIESDSMKDATQTLSIGSVLIATVTFGATFALPGGYKADDRTNGGSPTLAGTYAFDAFMMANTLAFICSSMATVGFMFSGTPMVNRRSRKFHLRSSVHFMEASVTSLTAAFALGVYLVLAPVAYKTAIAICVVSPFALLWKNVDYWKRWIRFAGPLLARNRPCWTLQEFARQFVWSILLELWPLVIIFCWAAFANTGTHF
ncbi:hypothetical protein VPH35_069114 [Triticum aestivum]